MTGCPERRDAVAESALGDAVESGLGEHLAACPGCADALRECRRAAARMDEALRRRAAAEPPLYGPDRVMARIDGRSRANTRLLWRWASLGSATAVLIASALWTMHSPPHGKAAALASWRSPTESLLQPPVGAAWNTMPRVGELFFEMKPLGETHAQ